MNIMSNIAEVFEALISENKWCFEYKFPISFEISEMVIEEGKSFSINTLGSYLTEHSETYKKGSFKLVGPFRKLNNLYTCDVINLKILSNLFLKSEEQWANEMFFRTFIVDLEDKLVSHKNGEYLNEYGEPYRYRWCVRFNEKCEEFYLGKMIDYLMETISNVFSNSFSTHAVKDGYVPENYVLQFKDLTKRDYEYILLESVITSD